MSARALLSHSSPASSANYLRWVTQQMFELELTWEVDTNQKQADSFLVQRDLRGWKSVFLSIYYINFLVSTWRVGNSWTSCSQLYRFFFVLISAKLSGASLHISNRSKRFCKCLPTSYVLKVLLQQWTRAVSSLQH